MKKITISTMLFVLISLIATHAFAANDAWGKTKWGMTVAQTSKVLNGNMYKKSATDDTNIYTADPIVIDGHEFKVLLYFDNGLSKVELSYNISRIHKVGSLAFDSVVQSLKEKYGPPNSFNVKDRGPASYYLNKEAEWITESSIIKAMHLGIIASGQEQTDMTVVSYKPRKKSGVDNL